jgi:hypothetical protein
VAKRSSTDADARLLRCRRGFVLGYTAQIAVSEAHLIVAQRVIQSGNDNSSLLPMVDLVTSTCGSPPERVVADSGFYTNQNVDLLEERGVKAYVPDSLLARELNLDIGPPSRFTRIRASARCGRGCAPRRANRSMRDERAWSSRSSASSKKNAG